MRRTGWKPVPLAASSIILIGLTEKPDKFSRTRRYVALEPHQRGLTSAQLKLTPARPLREQRYEVG